MHIFAKPSRQQVAALLSDCDLPFEDLNSEHLEHFFGCGEEDAPKGVVGLEIYGSVALLRSLAVAENARGRGCGRTLVDAAERYAKARGVKEVFLLTTSAKSLFESLGYEVASRESAPDAIKATSEFSAVCPASATFMRKPLVTGG
jgi:amino-acid N-acetyltransferase